MTSLAVIGSKAIGYGKALNFDCVCGSHVNEPWYGYAMYEMVLLELVAYYMQHLLWFVPICLFVSIEIRKYLFDDRCWSILVLHCCRLFLDKNRQLESALEIESSALGLSMFHFINRVCPMSPVLLKNGNLGVSVN